MTAIKSVTLPEFFGDLAVDTLSAKAWTNLVDRAKTISTWNSEKTVQFAQFVLRDKAAIWLQNLIEANSGDLATWEAFKKIFLDRFHIKRTISEQAQLREGLKLNKNETVANFYDRCESTQYIIDEATWQASNDAAILAARKTAHEKALELAFISGLPPAIRELLVLEDTTTLKNLRSLALRAESAQRDKDRTFRKVETACIDSTMSTNAIRTKQGFGRGYNTGNRRGATNGRGLARPSSAQPCFKCNSPSHWHLDCPSGQYRPQYSSPNYRGRPFGRGNESRGRGRGGAYRTPLPRTNAVAANLCTTPPIEIPPQQNVEEIDYYSHNATSISTEQQNFLNPYGGQGI